MMLLTTAQTIRELLPHPHLLSGREAFDNSFTRQRLRSQLVHLVVRMLCKMLDQAPSHLDFDVLPNNLTPGLRYALTDQ